MIAMTVSSRVPSIARPCARAAVRAALAMLCALALAWPVRALTPATHPGPELLALAAPGAGAVGRPRAPARDLDATDAYRLALLKMKAHLVTARALLRQRVGAPGSHVRAPLATLYDRIADEAGERGAMISPDILRQLDAAAGHESPLALTSALETAFTAVDGSLAQSGRMSEDAMLALARALFRDAVEHYTAAVSADHEVADVRRYQTGRGYVAVAEALLRRAAADGEAGEYDALTDAVAVLREAWPSVVPPTIVFAPERVRGFLEEVEAAVDAID